MEDFYIIAGTFSCIFNTLKHTNGANSCSLDFVVLVVLVQLGLDVVN